MQVHQALIHHARHTPDAVALVDGDAVYSYAQLHRAAQAIAALLRAQAPAGAPGGPLRRHVAVCMRKSALAVASLYGVLLAGGSYVPVEPHLPAERVDHLLRETNSLCLLVDEAGVAHAEHCTTLPRFQLDARVFDSEAPHDGVAGPLAVPMHDDDAAAVLFTSGSTGLPKGALITHGNLRAFTRWARTTFDLQASDRFASHASLSFDLSFFDLYAASAVGASVLLVPAAAAGSGALLLRFIEAQRPTVWQSVPSALGLIEEHATAHGLTAPSPRLVLFAGERMPVPRLKQLLHVFPQAEHVNVYGCTETNDSFFYRVPRDADIPDPLPIGRLIDGMGYRVLDDDLRPVPAGTPGLLWVTGPTVMTGYLRADQNDAVFRDLPADPHDTHGRGPTTRFYCSRDQVVMHADGDLRFIGRIDGVVKVSGFRVSLQEVEDRLAEHAGVEEAAVLAVPDDRLGHRMVAVVRPVASTRLTTLDMKLHCASRMARYMVPQSFVFTTVPLPQSANGKVDKKQLAARHAAAASMPITPTPSPQPEPTHV